MKPAAIKYTKERPAMISAIVWTTLHALCQSPKSQPRMTLEPTRKTHHQSKPLSHL